MLPLYITFVFYLTLIVSIVMPVFLLHQDRNYITIKSRVLYPEFRGRMVCTRLSCFLLEWLTCLNFELSGVKLMVHRDKGTSVDFVVLHHLTNCFGKVLSGDVNDRNFPILALDILFFSSGTFFSELKIIYNHLSKKI